MSHTVMLMRHFCPIDVYVVTLKLFWHAFGYSINVLRHRFMK